MVGASCHRCGYEWDYTGQSDRYGCCPNCKTSVKLPREGERAAPEAARDSPERPNTAMVEVEAGAEERREVTLAEAVEAMDRSVAELYELSASESETVGEVVQEVEEQGESLSDLRDGLEEVAGYFAEFIELNAGDVEVEYDHISREDDSIIGALEDVDAEGFEA